MVLEHPLARRASLDHLGSVHLLQDGWRHVGEPLEHHVGALAQRRIVRRVDGRLFCESGVKLGDVVSTGLIKTKSKETGNVFVSDETQKEETNQTRLERRLQPTTGYFVPVDQLEEGVRPDGLAIRRTAPQTGTDLSLSQLTSVLCNRDGG